MVHGHSRRSYLRSDGTFVKATNVRTHCRTQSQGYSFTLDRFKKGSPKDWPHKMEVASSWTEEEKERVIEALDDIPDALLDKNISGIYRLKRSKDFPNPGSSSPGNVVLYDSAFDSSRNIGQIIAHELSHQNYGQLSDKEKQDYRLATGWHTELEPDGKIYWNGRKDGYVEEDGRFSREEDYANNVEYFLYNPDKLKKVTPSAYDWIKKHFGESFKLKGGKK